MKYITTVLIYLVLIAAMAYTFNHISPWLGVAVAICAIYLAAKQLDNQINKK